MTRQFYDFEVVRAAIRSETAVDAVVQSLYPEAVLDQRENVWRVANVNGGVGNSCIFNRGGSFAGRFQDFGSPGDLDKGDLLDAVRVVKGGSFPEAAAFVGELLGLPKAESVPSKPKPVKSDRAPSAATEKSAIDGYRARLRNCPEALAYLQERGLTRKTIDHFKLGLMQAYPREGLEVGPTILAPVQTAHGAFEKPFPKISVPGLTQNPVAKDWCSGAPRSYWAAPLKDQTTLFICEGMKDLWRVWQEISDSSLGIRMAVLTSTHGTNIPEEWRSPTFWGRFDRIYLGHDNDAAGEKTANLIKTLAAREFCRVEVPRKMGKDWTDYFKSGGDLISFEEMLDKARPQIAPIMGLGGDHDSMIDLDGETDGLYAAKPINVNGAFHNGQMYYPYRVREAETRKVRVQDDDGSMITQEKVLHRYKTMVMRSDGSSLPIIQLEAPEDTPMDDRIIALADGTMITHKPNPNHQATWELASIKHYQKCISEDRAPHRPLKDIFASVVSYLKQCAWLTGDEEYVLLASYVFVSHCFTVFDAIPLFLINGEKGTGKSTAAMAIADLAFNGTFMGSTASEKGIIRHVDEARGLIVIDDLEKVGRRPGREDNGFEDFNQFLKLSYSKDGGRKVVTEISGKTRVLDFYGPKVVTNISGIDAVNATRMYTITTKKMPLDVQRSGAITGRDIKISAPLRQELHCWGMANCMAVAGAYKEKLSSLSDRSAQIAAPLQAIVSLAGDDALSALLQSALLKQDIARNDVELDAVGYLKMALSECIARGLREVSVLDIERELHNIPDAGLGQVNQPEDLRCLNDSRWISSTLLRMEARLPGEGARRRIEGLQVRFHQLRQDYINFTIEERLEKGLHIDKSMIRRTN